MFESVVRDDAVQRFRAASFPPLAAFLAAQLYFAIYPLLARVPAALFWSVAVILLAGAVVGAAGIVRALRFERVRGRAVAWLVAAIAVDAACAWLFVAITFPWL